MENDFFQDSIDDIISLLNKNSVLEPKKINQPLPQYPSI